MLPKVMVEICRENSHQNKRSLCSKNDRRSSQDGGGRRDPVSIIRTNRLCNLPHAATINSQTGDALGEIGNRTIQTRQSESRGTQ